MSNKDIVERLTERFFTPQFIEQHALAEKVLACRSTSDFQKLKFNPNSAAASGIFEAATFSDPEAKKLTKTRIEQIFNSLKPVRGNSTFL